MPPPPAHLDSHRSRSPSIFQRLGGLDLFNNLLFNREKVYQSFKRFSPTRTNAVKSEKPTQDWSVEGGDHIVQSFEDEEEGKDMSGRKSPRLSGMKRIDMRIKKPRAKPRKKTSPRAKSTGPLGTATSKKRSLPATTKTERASKVRKPVPKANTKKRVNGRGSSMADAFVISDSENDRSNLSQSESLTPPRQMEKIDSPDSDHDLKPTFTPTPAPAPAPTPTHGRNLEHELTRVKAAHARELVCLQHKLSASETKAAEFKGVAEREALELQRLQSIARDKQMADWKEELETERQRLSDLSWECAYLRREREEARSCLKGEEILIQQRDHYERLYREGEDSHAVAIRRLEQEGQEQTHRANDMDREMQQLARQIVDLKRQVKDVKNENAALKISAQSTPSPRSCSPSPSVSYSQSMSASDTDLRLVNIRKTYITVKRRYDSLYSVANNIATTTRSWDYSSHGEFGQYLRQLKTAIDENGPEEQGLVAASPLAKVE